MSLKKIEQTIDLEELFGMDLSGDEGLATALGQVLIDKMQERVSEGVGYGGVKLKSPYSKMYSESLEFKAAGKSRSEVNMSLTGDMLASIDVEASGNKIKISVSEDQVPKAFNHITGDTVPKRNFFGFSPQELKEIVKDFKPKVKRALKDGPSATDELANDLLDSLDEGDDV